MKVIGLTGGIGSGKSTVSNYLMNKGYKIIDADQIARNIVELNSETLYKIQNIFGDEILLEDGKLNRKGLAEIVFSNSEKREQLDCIMHKEIIKIIIKTIEDARTKGEIKAIFVDAPLLFETGLDKEMDQTWVVDAHDELRIKRVVIRDGSTRKLVKSQIDNQMSREEKTRRATVILDNSTTKEMLYQQIETLLLQL